MSTTYWRSQASFGHLADELAQDRVVFFTGAGISLALRTHAHNTPLPSWLQLLQGLAADATALSPDDRRDIDCLLDASIVSPQSSHFLEAASIISKVPGRKFLTTVAERTKAIATSTSDTHREIFRCHPRGILTYNYDQGHENAEGEIRSASGGPTWTNILPSSPDTAEEEGKIRAIIAANNLRNVLIKAHGTQEHGASLVLTRESYRELLVRNPAYRTLLSQIFLNYTLAAVGFGMDDPDFQDALDEMGHSLGEGIGRHVFFDREPEKSAATDDERRAAALRAKRDVVLRRRYRFEPIYCRQWADVPRILADLRDFAGPAMRTILDSCIDERIEKRHEAHAKLAHLSDNGAALAVREIEVRLRQETTDWRCSEWCYALGKIRPLQHRISLILKYRIEKRAGLREVGIAVMMLADYAKLEDIAWLEDQARRWRANPHPDARGKLDPQDRIPSYFEYLIKKTAAKYATWNQARS